MADFRKTPRGLPCPQRRPQSDLPAGTVLWSVHPTEYPQPSFNPTIERDGRGSRFGPTARDPYAAMYAGESEDVAFAETVVRRRRGNVLSPTHLSGRSLSSFEVLEDLTLVDLRSGGALTTWRADTWLLHCCETEYSLTRQWPPWFRTCVRTAHGLRWTSRKSVVGDAFVFFGDRLDSVDHYFAPGFSIRLDSVAGMGMAADILRDTFDIELGVLRDP